MHVAMMRLSDKLSAENRYIFFTAYQSQLLNEHVPGTQSGYMDEVKSYYIAQNVFIWGNLCKSNNCKSNNNIMEAIKSSSVYNE